MSDLEIAIQQLKVYLNTNAFFVKKHKISVAYDGMDQCVVLVKLECINIQNSESDFIKAVRAIRSKIPRIYPVRIEMSTVL